MECDIGSDNYPELSDIICGLTTISQTPSRITSGPLPTTILTSQTTTKPVLKHLALPHPQHHQWPSNHPNSHLHYHYYHLHHHFCFRHFSKYPKAKTKFTHITHHFQRKASPNSSHSTLPSPNSDITKPTHKATPRSPACITTTQTTIPALKSLDIRPLPRFHTNTNVIPLSPTTSRSMLFYWTLQELH